MPTIPRLERRTVTPSSRVSSVSTPDISSVGTALGGAIERVRDKRTQYELADARSKLSILSHQQNNAYDNDDDYATIGERWDQSMSKGVDDIASGISDPEARNFFMMDARERVEASRPRINAVAFSKERDVKRADMNTHLNGLREIVMGDDIEAAQQAISDAKDLYDGAAAAGYVGHEEGTKTIELWKQDSAIGRVRKVAPKDRTKLLKDPVITANIPSDKLAELQREADDAVLDEQAMETVDTLGDFSLATLYRTTDNISDPDLRRKVEARGEEVFKNRRTAKMEQAEEFHQQEFVPVLLGEKELDTNSNEFRALPTNLQADLIRADAARKEPAKKTDPWIGDKLNELYFTKDFVGLREYYKNNIGNMSAADQAKWSKISWQGVVPTEWKSKFTDTQMIYAELSRGGKKVDVTTKDQVTQIINDWHESQIENGVNVTDKDVLAKIKETVATVELDPSAMWLKGERKYYTLTPEERDELTTNTMKSPSEVEDNQLNIVIRDVLENRNDTKLFTDAARVGLSNPERLDQRNQKALAEKIAEFDPDLTAEIMTTAVNAVGRTPSAEEFLRLYERARKSQ